jgi:hypothetical protein
LQYFWLFSPLAPKMFCTKRTYFRPATIQCSKALRVDQQPITTKKIRNIILQIDLYEAFQSPPIVHLITN